MAFHPANLALRFLLELAALASLGLWGWRTGVGLSSWVLAVGLPVVAAVLWGTFAVPGDRSRSGRALVPVPGWARLALEGALFVSAVICLRSLELTPWAIALGATTLVHYGLSAERVRWLLTARAREG